MLWHTSRFQIDLRQPQVMGIVNVTPDSFSDGGRYASTGQALRHCEALLRDGAHMLDIGGESSRPGAQSLPAAIELQRVLPVVRDAIRFNVPISVDTYKPQVMRAVLDLGADVVNDIWALRWSDPAEAHGPSSMEVIASHPSCGVCLMHMYGEPATMQLQTTQGDVLSQVGSFLTDAARRLEARGVVPARIVLDPGIGFGKTVAQNFSLLARQHELLAAGYPLLAGWSRKSSLAVVVGATLQTGAVLEAGDRMLPSVVAAVLAVERGARIVRVHDVRETVAALKVWHAASADQLAQQQRDLPP